jgi:hypothetical protein
LFQSLSRQNPSRAVETMYPYNVYHLILDPSFQLKLLSAFIKGDEFQHVLT